MDISNQRHRQLVQSSDHFQQMVPLSEKGLGIHFVDLWVGTPPRRQTLIVDTGSGITYFPCSKCKKCGSSQHMDKVFIESQSSTFLNPKTCDDCTFGECDMEDVDASKNLCKVPMDFENGFSWSAYEVRDVAYVGGEVLSKSMDNNLENISLQDTLPSKGTDPMLAPAFQFQLSFACQTKLSTSSYEVVVDGIMGMDNTDASFFRQMHKSGVISQPSFSVCFHRPPMTSHASSDKLSTGALTFGGTDDRLHNTEMKFATNLRTSGYYTLHLKKIFLRTGGGTSAYDNDTNSSVFAPIQYQTEDFDGRDVMLVSSTPDTYITNKIKQQFMDAWSELTGFAFENISKMTFTEDALEKLPTVLFQFEGIEDENNKSKLLEYLDAEHPNDILIAMPPSHYLAYHEEEKLYTPSIQFTGENEIILGSNFMQNHNILFDQQNQRIGFAESTCEYSSIVVKDSPDSQEKAQSKKMGGNNSCGSFFCSIGILFGLSVGIFIAIMSWKVSEGWISSKMGKTPMQGNQNEVSFTSPKNENSLI